MALRRDPDKSALTAFADELRAYRALAGLSRDELAEKLAYSPSLVAMIETARRTPSRDFAGRCDQALGTPGTFARLEERLRSVPFPVSFRPFAAHEAVAVSLRSFEHSLVPGLLQTPEYARAVLGTRPNTSQDEIEDLVAARLARQDVLAREDPPLLWVLIDEGVLYREVGPVEVMYGQLLHLAEMSRRPNITIQVVPYSAGAHSGLLGAFVIAEVDDTPPIAYLDTAAEGETIEEPSVVAQVLLTFDSLRSEALPHGASRDMIMRVAEERWR